MPTYLTPGVYVEEVPSASKPIEGVGTSIAAFVGLAPGGPVNTPMRISNWTQFAKIFGDPNEPDNGPFMEGAYLAHSVYGFFQNGGNAVLGRARGRGRERRRAPRGRRCRRRPTRRSRPSASSRSRAPTATSRSRSPRSRSAGRDGGETDLQARWSPGSASNEEYTGLTLKKGRNNLATKVNAASKLIKIEETGASLPEAQRVPATGAYKLSAPRSTPGGVKPTISRATSPRRQGMGGLAAVDEITMVVMPDIMALANDGDDVQLRDLQGKMIAHCENAGDRMAILDARRTCCPQEILEWRMNTAGYDSKFAALYYPWIEVMDPLTNQPMMVPPSGHVAGVWCRTDATRGVHKAPANEVVLGANGLGFQVTQAEQGGLNKVGINCIRAFPGRGIRVWGARTLSSDPEWRYINVRRLFNYVSESIMEGTQWTVFEPNDERLWMQLRIAASNFLTRVVARRRAVRLDARAGVLRQVRRGDQPAGGDRGRPGHLRDRHRAGQAGGVRRLPDQPVQRRRGRPRSASRVPQTDERSTGMPANDKEAHVPHLLHLKIGGARGGGYFKEVTGFDSESEVIEHKRSMPNGRRRRSRRRATRSGRTSSSSAASTRTRRCGTGARLIVDGKLDRTPARTARSRVLDYEGSPVVTYSSHQRVADRSTRASA